MIVAELKPMAEITESLSGFRHVMVLGCGSCVTICLSGGEREAHILTRDLSGSRYHTGRPPECYAETIQRQCERDLVESFMTIRPETEAILSLACGAGVQVVSDVFDNLTVVPALNTTFLGAADAPGIWREKCQGCGDCLLTVTGGICPVGRCAKSLFNGPCGGSQGGRCEVHPETPCAWAMIYYRLKKQNKLHYLTKRYAPKDWRPGGSSGPRERKRTGIGDKSG